AHAADGDLVLEYKHYYSRFEKFVCKDTAEVGIAAPEDLQAAAVQFEDLNVSIFLDGAILTASYQQDASVCHYSALYSIDKNSKIITATETKAFATSGGSDCVSGKTTLDSYLNKIEYIVLHDHITLKLASQNAAALCGEGADSVIAAFARIRRK
ncbi:MAG: hypothetical protein J7501_15670, partial [Bdellovibrio sp.]|nr:hypothetical protein [Bdellovibrio sp.]